MENQEKILVIGLVPPGFIEQGLPKVRDAFPDGQIELLVNERVKKSLDKKFDINFIITPTKNINSSHFDKNLFRKIRSKRYEKAIAFLDPGAPNRTAELLLVLARTSERLYLTRRLGEGVTELKKYNNVTLFFNIIFQTFKKTGWFILEFAINYRLLKKGKITPEKIGLLIKSGRPKVIIWNYPPHVGNSLQCFPLISSIKAANPDSIIHIVTGRNIKGLLEMNSAIDHIIYFEDSWAGGNLKHKNSSIVERLRFIRLLKKERYDFSFDLSFEEYCSLFATLADIVNQIGFIQNYNDRKKYLAVAVPDRRLDHNFEKNQALQVLELAEAVGLSINPALEFKPSQVFLSRRDEIFAFYGIKRDGFLLGVHPGADWENKRWGIEKFAQLSEFIQNEHGGQIILTGGPNETGICQELNSLLGGRCLDFSGRLGLFDLAAIISGLDLFLVNNTGPMHIAASLGIPFLSFTGPSPVSWDPLSSAGNVLRSKSSCRPCDEKNCFHPDGNICMQSISVADAINECKFMDLGKRIQSKEAMNELG